LQAVPIRCARWSNSSTARPSAWTARIGTASSSCSPRRHVLDAAEPEQTTGDGVPSIFYEDRDLMHVRARRMEHPRAWSQKTAWGTNHLVSNVRIEKQDAKTVTVRSRFHMMEFRNDVNRHFAGSYLHHLEKTKAGFRIKLQRVDMVNGREPTSTSCRRGSERMRWLSGIAAALAVLAATTVVSAQSYPSRPIKLLVGYPAGGGQDLIGRLMANKLTESLGQPVVVENKPGASGLIATDTAAKSTPDGYTLLLGSSGPLTLNPLIFPKTPYDPVRDFVPISTFCFSPLMLAVHPDVPAHTPQEFIAYAKANPGKLNNGSSAVSMQLAAEMLNQFAGLSITTVRYAGSAAAVNALISGEVQLTILESTPLLPQIDAGKVRAIAVMSDRRISALPNLATMSEAGVPGYEITFWTGLFAPVGTSPEIVTKLGALLASYGEMPDVRERLKAIGAESGIETSAQLAARIERDIAKYGPVVKATNLKAE